MMMMMYKYIIYIIYIYIYICVSVCMYMFILRKIHKLLTRLHEYVYVGIEKLIESGLSWRKCNVVLQSHVIELVCT